MAENQFSVHNPRLQRAYDSTSLRALMFCPRFYELTILDGWRGSTVDLEFGLLFASAVEVFHKKRAAGYSRDEAQQAAVNWALDNSGSRDAEDVWSPWGGQWLEMWHCTHSPKRGTRKCQWAHAGKWFPPPAPFTCGACGSEVETLTRWLAADNVKNRHTLIRLVCWYCEDQPIDTESGLQTLMLPDGKPAVELSGRLPLPWKTPGGEPYLLCFHLDRVATFGNEAFVVDNKTTKKTLGKSYWAGFSPAVQMDCYDLVGTTLFADLNIRGVMVEGAQTMVGGARFGLGVCYRSEIQREEFLVDLRWWLSLAEHLAERVLPDGTPAPYPMNRQACWLCPFKQVCSAQPAKREAVLAENFEKRYWNPLEER